MPRIDRKAMAKRAVRYEIGGANFGPQNVMQHQYSALSCDVVLIM